MKKLKTYDTVMTPSEDGNWVLKSEADREIRRLNRALYKMAANWALSTLAWLDCIDQGEPRKWSEMVQKCRAKAEEFKEATNENP